jgi:hypothetical protein
VTPSRARSWIQGELADHRRHSCECRPPAMHLPRRVDSHTDEEDDEVVLDRRGVPTARKAFVHGIAATLR